MTPRRGAAQLGYGDDDVVTKVSFGPNSSSKYITTWFRTEFTVADPGEFITATLGLVRDDGAVVYLNGKEVFRSNMPSGTISASTLASVTVGGTDESTIYEADLAPSRLLAGRNVLAVELHQIAVDSSDLSFSLQLTGLLQPTAGAPTISVRRLDGAIRLSWPATARGYSLLSAANPTGPWETIPESVLSSSGEQAVEVASSEGTRWFRLEKR